MNYTIKKQPVFFLTLILPAVVFIGIFLIYPTLDGMRLSFTNSSPLRKVEKYVGFDNYVSLLSDSMFWQVLLNTFNIVFISTVIGAIAGYLLALLLNSDIRFVWLIRTAIFQVWVVPWVVVSILWGWLFSYDFGVVNYILVSTGIIGENVNFLFDPIGAQFSIISAYAWRITPFMMVISLAALQEVSKEIIDAAKIDGASYLRIQFFIVLPILRNILLVMFLLQLVRSLQEMTMVFSLTQGGPSNSTMVLSLLTYKEAFESWEFGRSAALGTIWMLVVSLFSLFYMRTLMADSEK